MKARRRVWAFGLLAVLVASHTWAAAPAPKASAPVARKSASAAAATTAAPAVPIEFEGTLESGKTYFAEVAWDNNALHIWRPVKDVKVPRGHAWTIDWTDLARFPALKTAATRAKPQRFQFKVTGVDVSSGSPMIPWTTIYHCEVIGIDSVSGAPPPAARPK